MSLNVSTGVGTIGDEECRRIVGAVEPRVASYEMLSLHATTTAGKDTLAGILQDMPCVLVAASDVAGADAAPAGRFESIWLVPANASCESTQLAPFIYCC